MSTQFILVMLFALLVAISSVLSRQVLKKANDSLFFTSIHNLAGGLLVLPLIFFDHRMPAEIGPWIFFLAGTMLSIVGDYFYFKSIALEEISVLTLVYRLRTVLVFIFSLVLLGETATWTKVGALFLVTLGALVAAYQKGSYKMSKGVIMANLANLFLALMLIADKKVAGSISVPLYNFINFTSSSLFFLFLATGGKIDTIKSELKRLPLVMTIGAGGLLSLASICRRYAFTLGDLSSISPLLNLSVVFTVLLGILFLGERNRLVQKLVGVSLVLIGVWVL